MNAEIITIGTELLLGEIVDTNSAYIARAIRDIGVDLFFQTTVGDNEERVAAAVRAGLERADVLITTGGLGPTVDDVTRQAVAAATDRPLEFRPDLLDQIASRFQRWGAKMSPNNRQQAFVPAGAIALENPVGTAPCFVVETDLGSVICLPGVPREMIYMFENVIIAYLREKMGAPAVILARVLRTAGIGESRVDALIQDLERLSNPTVGLSAHAGQTDIRITAKAESVEKAEALIEPLVQEINRRLGINIYGEGSETVEEVVLALMALHNLDCAVAEVGISGELEERLAAVPRSADVVCEISKHPSWHSLAEEFGLANPDLVSKSLADRAEMVAEHIRARNDARVGLAVITEQDQDGRPVIAFGIVTPEGDQSEERGYGGPSEYVSRWAATLTLDRLRRWLLRRSV
jgi:competence/damage-inducible protein CinA-like protein